MLRIGTSEKLLLKYLATKGNTIQSDTIPVETVICDLEKVEKETGAYIYGLLSFPEQNGKAQAFWRDLRYMESKGLVELDMKNPHVILTPYGKFLSLFYELDDAVGLGFDQLGDTNC
ncbi:MAG TPA: hypothetical protein VMW14_00565 [Candidatus Paceibacterota bacterium]|nr:hypothetical protein [Candidatus Paceibacterota bacterium]